MADLTLTIPDGQLNRLVNAVAQQRGINISGFTNGQKLAMMKTDLVNYWKNIMQSSEVPAAVNTATADKIADINSNLTVT